MQSNISKFFLPKKTATDNRVSESKAKPPSSIPLTELIVLDDDEGEVKSNNITSSISEKLKSPPQAVCTFDPNEFLRKRTFADASGHSQASNKQRRILLSAGRSIYSMDEEDTEYGEGEEQNEILTARNASSPAAKVVYTPLEKQVVAIRQKYPDSLLMVECGYRMRFFGEDAVTAASVLGVWAHKDHNFMVASVPTYRTVFHCRRLLSAGLKVAIVRQTETAAIRKSNKGSSSSQTFERGVAGLFTAGTVVDDDDPAFDGLMGVHQQSSNTSDSMQEGGDNMSEDGDDCENDALPANNAMDPNDHDNNRDHWIASYFEMDTKVVQPTGGNDVVDLLDSDKSALMEEKCGAIVSVCVRAHSVWVRTFPLDTVHQSLVDFLDMLQPSEMILPDTVSLMSREIVEQFFAQQQQRQQAPAVVTDQLDGNAYDATRPTGKLMRRLKWLPANLYRHPRMHTSRKWEDSLSLVAQKAFIGLQFYLEEFQLQATLDDPQLNVFDPLSVKSSSSTLGLPTKVMSITQDSTENPDNRAAEIAQFPSGNMNPDTQREGHLSFPLDGVTVRDLELFDSLSNANEHMKGLSKLLQYQQQYLFHQQRFLHRHQERRNHGHHSMLPGGLFAVIDHCVSVYGRRTLRQWLLNPLSSVSAIVARQDAICWLLPGISARAEVIMMKNTSATADATLMRRWIEDFVQRMQDTLKKAPDIEKMLTSLQFNRIAPGRLKILLQLAMRLSVLHIPDTSSSDSAAAAAAATASVTAGLVQQHLPFWLREQLQKTDFQALATLAATFDQRIVLSQQTPAGDSSAAVYDPLKVQKESLTGFFEASVEDKYPALAALRAEKQSIEAAMFEELQQIRQLLKKPQLKFASLRNGALSVIEHLVELPLADEKKVPANWMKVNSTKQIVRFHTPTVLQLQEKLYRVRDECKIAGRDAWKSFVSDVKAAIYASLRIAIGVLGSLDAVLSLTQVAALPGYVRPIYQHPSMNNDRMAGREIHIVAGRHPVLERRFADSETPYLPNDAHLGNFSTTTTTTTTSASTTTSSELAHSSSGDDGHCSNTTTGPTTSSSSSSSSQTQQGRRLVQMVTGPNLGGKSSYCRMVALIALLGQMGSFVPADRAELVVFDNILTRMGSEDDLQSGRSTFLCELVRTNTILRHATANSLVIIDELGRGTATHDGYAIAQATLWYLLDHVQCMTLFITHFPNMTQPAAAVSTATAAASSTAAVDQSRGSSSTTQQETAAAAAAQIVWSHMSYFEHIVDAVTGEAEITFLYKLVEQPAKGSYGINVARLAGMKKRILDRAMVKAAEMDSMTSINTSMK